VDGEFGFVVGEAGLGAARKILKQLPVRPEQLRLLILQLQMVPTPHRQPIRELHAEGRRRAHLIRGGLLAVPVVDIVEFTLGVLDNDVRVTLEEITMVLFSL